MIKVFIKNKHLFKLADSKNDHTIPNNLCLNEINTVNKALNFLWELIDTSNIINDTGNTVQNIYQFNFNLQYDFCNELGNVGLLCLTGKKNNIIAKFEFYVQKLTEDSIDKAFDNVKDFCKQHHFLRKRTELQLKHLKKFLDTKMYRAIILIHDEKFPYKDLKSEGHNKYVKLYPSDTKFTDSLIASFIIEIIRFENFTLI